MEVNNLFKKDYDLKNVVSMGKDLLILKDADFVPNSHIPYRLQNVAIMLCRRGSISGTWNAVPLTIEGPCLIQLLPDCIVQVNDMSENVELQTIAISVDFSRLLEMSDYFQPFVQLHRYPILDLTLSEFEIAESFFKMLSIFVSAKADYIELPEVVKNLFNGFLHVAKSFNALQKGQNKNASLHEELFYRFYKLVINEHTHSRKIKYYADKLCIDPKYMARIIKNVSGRTAADWIDSYVIMDVKYHLIYRKDMTLENISDALGFPNPSFFGRFFKSKTGTTPGSYRKGR